jgi:hypothetical protein
MLAHLNGTGLPVSGIAAARVTGYVWRADPSHLDLHRGVAPSGRPQFRGKRRAELALEAHINASPIAS